MLKVSDITPTLWPKAKYTSWFVPGAANKAKIAYGTDPKTGAAYDIGALRDGSNGAEVLTPGGSGTWVPYNPKEHHFIASVLNRVGPGWSFSSNSVHNAGRGWFRDAFQREPKPMENVDVQFNKAVYDTLRRIVLEGSPEPLPVFEDSGDGRVTPQPQPQPKPIPTPTPTPKPVPVPIPTPPPVIPNPPVKPIPPPVSSTASLSPASTRVEELRTIALQVGVPDSIARFLTDHAWRLTKPIFVDWLKTYRLMRKTAGDSREIPTEDKD